MKQQPLCLAPWVHSFVHTSGERAFCCVSERQAPIDSSFWNSESWRAARKELMEGKLPGSCSSCSYSEFPLYKQFDEKFGHLREEILSKTNSDGAYEGEAISFDHRNSYVCNFKCRMCNSEYSSAKKKEQIELFGKDSLPFWMRQEGLDDVSRFHSEFTEKELLQAIENQKVREIYWAGGEPLLNPFHWLAMDRIFELGFQSKVFIRYNTNLSRVEFQGRNFFTDIFQKLDHSTLMVSVDGTKEIGEFIRTGFQWSEFLANFRKALELQTSSRNVAISLCLTTPGILDLRNLLSFCSIHSVPVQAQSVDFGQKANFENPLHPQFFPKKLRDPWIQSSLEKLTPLRDEKNESVFQLLESFLLLPDQDLTEDRIKNIRGTLKKTSKIDLHRGGPRLLDFLDDQSELQKWLLQFQHSL